MIQLTAWGKTQVKRGIKMNRTSELNPKNEAVWEEKKIIIDEEKGCRNGYLRS